MHRTRTADSQVIAKRPFVCTPHLDQEYAETSFSIEIIRRELRPLLCKSHEAKLPVKHTPNWLYQWFWIWNALRHSIPFVTDEFGRKSICVHSQPSRRMCWCLHERKGSPSASISSDFSYGSTWKWNPTFTKYQCACKKWAIKVFNLGHTLFSHISE